MSRSRQLLFVAICLCSSIWVIAVLFVASIRFEHKGMIDMIRNGTAQAEPKRVSEALVKFAGTLRVIPCDQGLSDDYLLLRAYDTDQALNSGDDARADAALAAMEEALGQRLSCTPYDGKAWLDLAAVLTVREGLSSRALENYKMSARVAPAESWLAQKRLEFVLSFRPMLDQEALQLAQADIAVLERAQPNKMTAVKTAAGVESTQALRDIFAQQ